MKIDARRVEALIAERELTKNDLAALCGIASQNITKVIRRGSCEPRTVGKLARGLGVEISEILGDV